MPRDAVKQKIIKRLKTEFSSPKDKIILRDGFEDFLHVYVVSQKFKGKRDLERVDYVLSLLRPSLSDDEYVPVSMVETLLPQEAKKYWPPMPELNSR